MMDIKLIIPPEKNPYELSPSLEIAHGGEGTIYRLNPHSAVKVYYDKYQDRIHQEKILAVCSLYNNYKAILSDSIFAFPRAPGTNALTKQLIGFEMEFMGKFPTLEDITFNLTNDSFPAIDRKDPISDREAIALIYNLFTFLEKLADAKIVLCDINPRNILYNYNTKLPLFIDLDSAQIAGYGCNVFSSEYLDPVVENSGVNSDGTLKATIDGDIFGMSVIAYELFVGQRPFDLRCSPPTDYYYRKNSGISLLGYHKDSTYLKSKNVNLVNSENNNKHLHRLDILAATDYNVYTFFTNTLLNRYRQNLIYSLSENDPVNPNSIFKNKNSSCKTIAQQIGEGWDNKDIHEEEIRKKLATLKLFADSQTTDIILNQIFSVINIHEDIAKNNDTSGLNQFIRNFGFSYPDFITA